MNTIEDDILQSTPLMKEMPYDLPEGYFDSLKMSLKIEKKAGSRRPGIMQRFAPYLSLAAMFVMIAVGGGFFLERVSDSQDMTEEDFLLFADDLIKQSYYDYEDGYYAEASEIADEDIIEYLIYTGVSTETIELYK